VLLAATGETDRGIEQIADRGPMPEEAAILRDCLDHYLSALPENLREFAEMYLAGFSNSEIAQAKGCSKRKAERKVPLILAEWERIAAASVDRDEL
jgi:DNA-directed RNA polymerase specialized sigma24 family protein